MPLLILYLRDRICRGLRRLRPQRLIELSWIRVWPSPCAGALQ